MGMNRELVSIAGAIIALALFTDAAVAGCRNSGTLDPCPNSKFSWSQTSTSGGETTEYEHVCAGTTYNLCRTTETSAGTASYVAVNPGGKEVKAITTAVSTPGSESTITWGYTETTYDPAQCNGNIACEAWMIQQSIHELETAKQSPLWRD